VLKNLIFIELMIAIGTAIFYILSARATRRDVGIMPGIVFGLMAAIAFLSPNLIVAYIAVGLIPLAFGRTKVQVGIIVAAGLFALPTLPTNLMLGTAWLFPWTMQTTVALGGLIAMLVAPGRMGRAPPWADASMIMVILVLIFIDARAGAPIGYLRGFATYFFDYAIPVFLITRCARNPTEWRTLLAAIAAIGCILAAVVLYEARGGWPLYSPLYGHYGFPVESVVKFRGGVMRAYGSLEEATALGATLVICFCAALAARRAFASNLAYVAIVSLIAVGTLAPQSRGGMIGIAVAFVVSSFYRRGIGSVTQVGLAGLLLSGIYVGTTVFGSFGAQISTSLEEAQGSGDYRTQLLRRGMQEFWKNPIIGDNYANVVARMQDMVQGEGMVDFVNTYLYFALFAGAVGLVIFCVSFLVPMARLVTIRRALPPGSAEREVAGFCLAVLMSAAVMIVFTSYLKRPSIFWLASASLAMMIVVPRRAVAGKTTIRVSGQPAAA
jgi:O-Antigen ligase